MSNLLSDFYVNTSAEKIIKKEITINDVLKKYKKRVKEKLKALGYNENGDLVE